MSASMAQVELSPRSTHGRLPEWFARETEARSRSPLRREAVWHSRTRPVGNYGTTLAIHPRKRHRQFDDPEYRRARLTALASVVAAVAWTSFCITTAFVRLDSENFGKWRDWLITADEPVMPLSERLEAAIAALREVSRGADAGRRRGELDRGRGLGLTPFDESHGLYARHKDCSQGLGCWHDLDLRRERSGSRLAD